MAAIRITAAQAYPALPSIADDIAAYTDKVNFLVTKYILGGFDYTVKEKSYHFSFDDQDQANFTQELLRAVNVATQGQEALAKYTAHWRGHDLVTKTAETLTLSVKEFNDLAMYAGSWKSAVLAYGWDIKNRLSSCKTKSELMALNDYYRIEQNYLAARDSQPFTLVTSDGVDIKPVLPGEENKIPDLDTPKLYFKTKGGEEHEVTGKPGEKIAINLILDDSTAPEDTQFHLHMFAYECQVADYHTLDTYGPGVGQGFDGTLAELREWCKDASVIISDKYGFVDISLYPVSAGGLSTVNFYVCPDTLPPREGRDPTVLNDEMSKPTTLPAVDSDVVDGAATLEMDTPESFVSNDSLDSSKVIETLIKQNSAIARLQNDVMMMSQQLASFMQKPAGSSDASAAENIGNAIKYADVKPITMEQPQQGDTAGNK